MQFELTEEQRMVVEMVRDFARTEIAPTVKEYEPKGEFPRRIIERLGELGLLGMNVPEEYGGAGMDTVSACLAIRELARVCPSTAIIVSVTNAVYCEPLLHYGTEEQKRKYLAPAARGEFLGGFALTEPAAGSDAQALEARAVRQDGGGYLLNGVKAWVTNGGVGRGFVVMAVTDPPAGSRRLSAFILDPSLSGFRFGKVEEKMGLRASTTTEIILEDCLVPRDNLLGEEGTGLRIALSTLDGSRIGVAAQSLGVAQGALDAALEYTQHRRTFGKALREHQTIQFLLADAATELEAGSLLMLRAASLRDAGRSFGREASMAKLYCSEMAGRVTSTAVQIFGAYGYSKEYAVERFFRDARVLTIYEGTSEIQRLVVARSLLRG